MSETRPRLLLVEDHDDTRTLYQHVFAQEPYDVEVCSSGKDAIVQYLEVMHCRPPAGILMDLGLADINGVRVIRAIREIEHGSPLNCTPIRIGIVSASLYLLEGLALLDTAQVTLTLQKPIAPPALLLAVRAWLSAPAPCLLADRTQAVGRAL